jgi:hypothetical protein
MEREGCQTPAVGRRLVESNAASIRELQAAIDVLPIDSLYICAWPRNRTFFLERSTCSS